MKTNVDLPAYNGDYGDWQDVAYTDSLIYHAILGLGEQKEASALGDEVADFMDFDFGL